MNYQRIYDSIISRAKERKLEAGTYKERHHIIPRCMNGTDDEDNLVDLTPEEHYVCHQLLVKIYPGNIKLMYAVRCMSMMKGSVGKRTNKLYGWLRRKYSIEARTGISKECKHCNREFYAHNHRTDKPFCSKQCFIDFTSVEITCANCSRTFKRARSLDTAKVKFCSVECKVKFHSHFFNCERCGQEFRRPSCRIRMTPGKLPRFCSRKCKGNCK